MDTHKGIVGYLVTCRKKPVQYIMHKCMNEYMLLKFQFNLLQYEQISYNLYIYCGNNFFSGFSEYKV